MAGYYAGFELEISSESYDVEPIKAWADKHLGAEDLLQCKEDSSVAGFEIASMPMTPEFFRQVNWESFMEMLNNSNPVSCNEEPPTHGLHIHLGKIAFRENTQCAQFAYLLGLTPLLDAVARRTPTSYCSKDKHIATKVLARDPRHGARILEHYQEQAQEWGYEGLSLLRNSALNFTGNTTIEVRAFRSTRDADELRDAFNLVTYAADYIRLGRDAAIPITQWLSPSAFIGWLGGINAHQAARFETQVTRYLATSAGMPCA
jgi:hypothetical protein